MDLSAKAVVIVGGGLSGLAAAVQLAQAGVPAMLFDEAAGLGGRARTECRSGFHLNYGPHRLYERGAAVQALRKLGVAIDTAVRGPNGGIAVWRGRKHTWPVGYCSLLTTGLFGTRAKRELAHLLASLPAVGLDELQRVPIGEWVRTHLRDPHVQQLVLALVRYTTYCDDPDGQSAAAALGQLQLSAGAMLYIHNGWGALVAQLQDAAASGGVAFVRGRRAVAVTASDGRAVSVTFADGTSVPAGAVIVATGPEAARRLLNESATVDLVPPPVRIAALDIALRSLPHPRTVFALGIDEPWSFSADSSVARVAPLRGAVIHLAKYLRTGTTGTPFDERHLERALDLLQPGWRVQVVYRRFLPTVVVSHALVAAERGGFAGRPTARVPEMSNVFLAGDWVGPAGQLADACVASGVEAGRQAAQVLASEGAQRAH